MNNYFVPLLKSKKNIMSAISLSQDLLAMVKIHDDPSMVITELEMMSPDIVFKELDNEPKKKAFWINIYNGFSIVALKPNPDVLLDESTRTGYFQNRMINIAGYLISLHDIENQILRNVKAQDSEDLKHFFEKMALKPGDYRIHFALNCGGSSCPPVKFYDPEIIEEQLDAAAVAFLSQEGVENASGRVYLSEVMEWYKEDFGNEPGIKEILKQYKVIDDDEPEIVYKPYDWHANIENFSV
jgi:hypothetical protein